MGRSMTEIQALLLIKSILGITDIHGIGTYFSLRIVSTLSTAHWHH